MNKLPYWNIPINIPARYDSDSATAIEQTARVYAAMQELIDNYNEFVESVNNSVTEIDKNTHDDMLAFEEKITKLMNDFTECINTKMDNHQLLIDDYLEKFKELSEIINDFIVDYAKSDYLGDNTGFNYKSFTGDCNELKSEAHIMVDVTATNKPIESACYLDVSTHDNGTTKLVRQIATKANTGNEMYLRIFDGSVWTEWERIATTKFVYDSISESLNIPGVVVEGV